MNYFIFQNCKNIVKVLNFNYYYLNNSYFIIKFLNKSNKNYLLLILYNISYFLLKSDINIKNNIFINYYIIKYYKVKF
jgi:hypothetical protein